MHRHWPPEPKVEGSSPSWRTRLISIEIGEKLSFIEGFFLFLILKFTHAYSNFNATLTKPKSAFQSILCSLIWKIPHQILDFISVFNYL